MPWDACGPVAPEPRADHRNLFGKAFLLHLQRGDLEMARLFAKAFLLESQVAISGEETVAAESQ